MKLVFADNSPLAHNKPGLVIGSDDDVYRFRRNLVIPCSPRLVMEEGDSLQDWATVVKFLDGVSWNLPVSLRLRKTADGSSHSVNLFVETDNEGCRSLLGVQKLFNPNVDDVSGEVIIKVGRSVCFQTRNEVGLWCGKVETDGSSSKDDYTYDVRLTIKKMIDILWAKDSNITFSFWTWKTLLEASPMEFLKRLLRTGHFSDCEVTSKECVVTPCHKVILMEGSGELKKQIDAGSSKINLELSTAGVTAFLYFLYCGDLDDAKEDSNLAFELLMAAGAYEAPKLWTGVEAILLGKDLDVKTACEGFAMIVKAKKLESAQDLARKLVSITIKEKSSVKGFLKGDGVMDAWLKLVPVVGETKKEDPPAKRVRTS